MPTYGTRRIPFDWRGFITPGVKLLVLVCVGVFLAQTLLQILVSPDFEYHRFKQIFGLVPSAVIPGLRIWQPFTYIFLHGGVGHLLINMLWLWMFGRELELVWGKRRFLNSHRQRNPLPGSPNLALPIAGEHPHAPLRRGDGCDRILFHAWVWWRRNRTPVPLGRHACGLRLSAARFFPLQRA